jgi:hypothetical protein
MKHNSTLRGWFWILAALFITAVYFGLRPQAFHLILIDCGVYATAIDTWISGGDPYLFVSGADLPFVYPPLFLYLGALFARLLTPHIGWIVYVALHLIATAAIPWILHRFYLQTGTVGPLAVYALYFAAPGFIGMLATETGNIAVMAYAMLLLAIVPGLRHNRWLFFYLAVLLCTIAKPSFLPFLLLPVLFGRRQILQAVLAGLLSAATLIGQRWAAPALYARFSETLAKRTREVGDVGVSVFGLVFHVLHNLRLPGQIVLPVLAYGALVLTVLTALLRLRSRPRTPPWYALVLLGVLFLNPRLEYYDFCIAFPLAFFIFIETIPLKFSLPLYFALVVPALFFLIRHRDSVANGGIGAVAILIFWAATSYRVLRTPPPLVS